MTKEYQSKAPWSQSLSIGGDSSLSDCNMFLSSGKKILTKMMFGLIPSFVQRRIRPLSTKQHRLHPTSYLDGLRGVASFVVFMGHYTEENLGWYTEPYGLYEDGAPSSPFQLPFLRVIYSARPMVHIFFIISGFVLSYKPLMQIHSQQYSSLATTLSSSVFRRALRLFLPSFVILFIMAIAVYTGFSDDRYAGHFFDLSSQLADVWGTCWGLLETIWIVNDLFPPHLDYNPALWTIPVEFAQSMILFIVLIGLSRCYSNIRLFLLAGIIVFCFYGGQMYTIEFLGGMFIAEIILLNDCSTTPTSSPTLLPKYSPDEKRSDDKHNESCECSTTIKTKTIQTFWFLNLLCGLFIASWTNNHVDELWGLSFLSAHTPGPYEGQRIWFCFGAFQIVGACTQLKCVQNIFNTPVAQYLGNISYALYIVHNLCLAALEPRIVPYLDYIFGRATSTGRHLSWLVGLIIYVPIIICAADIFWRAIDMPTVKFARWLETRCVVEERKK